MISSPTLLRCACLPAFAVMLLGVQGCSTPSAAVPAAPATPAPVGVAERAIPIRLLGETKKDAPRTVIVEELEKLPQTEYSVMDPYSKKQTVYRGVLVRDFVKQYGGPRSGSLHFRALDDFKADLNSGEWNRWDILLATRTNGERMSIANNGPARIVFPYDTHKEINPTVYNDKWIWQIKQVTFDK
jgi:hypothetical protein